MTHEMSLVPANRLPTPYPARSLTPHPKHGRGWEELRRVHLEEGERRDAQVMQVLRNAEAVQAEQEGVLEAYTLETKARALRRLGGMALQWERQAIREAIAAWYRCHAACCPPD